MNSRSSVSVLLLLLCALLAWDTGDCANGQRQRQQQRPRRYFGGTAAQRPRFKRMYALCPPQFERIGNECYFLSSGKANWLDAQFQCQDRDSKLAEPNKVDDRRLRKHFLASEANGNNSELWLGGKYDWTNKNWLWGYKGQAIKYQAFARPRDRHRNANLDHHCTLMNRSLKYRWTASPCMEEHFFICQHNMPVVKKNNLQHIYNMWNITFPNQVANEIEVIFTNKDGDTSQRFQVAGQDSQKWSRIDGSPRNNNRNVPEANGQHPRPAELRRNPNEMRRHTQRANRPLNRANRPLTRAQRMRKHDEKKRAREEMARERIQFIE